MFTSFSATNYGVRVLLLVLLFSSGSLELLAQDSSSESVTLPAANKELALYVGLESDQGDENSLRMISSGARVIVYLKSSEEKLKGVLAIIDENTMSVDGISFALSDVRIIKSRSKNVSLMGDVFQGLGGAGLFLSGLTLATINENSNDDQTFAIVLIATTFFLAGVATLALGTIMKVRKTFDTRDGWVFEIGRK